MKKPEKKEPYPFIETDEVFVTMKRQGEVVGYNQCHDEYEKFLPNLKEILSIIHKVEEETKGHYDTTDIAEAIDKRLQ